MLIAGLVKGYSQTVKIRPRIASISPGGLKPDYT